MNRVELDVLGDVYILPINPVEYQDQNAFEHTLDKTINRETTRFAAFGDPRHRVMTWRNLENKYPYTQLVSGLKHAIGISGVKINFRDLNILGDQDEWQDIYIEDVRVVYRKGRGSYNSINHLSYDLEMIFNLG